MSAKRKAPQCRAMELQNRQINRADQSQVQYNKYRSFLEDLGFPFSLWKIIPPFSLTRPTLPESKQ